MVEDLSEELRLKLGFVDRKNRPAAKREAFAQAAQASSANLPRYDYSITRFFEFRGQIFEHRRLQACDSHRSECEPEVRDIKHLQYRAEKLGHNIILETPETFLSVERKFGSVPGMIFITDCGREVSRGKDYFPVDIKVEPEPEIGPSVERAKFWAVLRLCNIVGITRKDLMKIIGKDFSKLEIYESAYIDRVAEVRSF